MRQLDFGVIMPVSDQKISNHKYQVIPRVLIFVVDDPRVLLLRGDKNKKIWAGKYNGVGGHVEDGEDILSAAKRELQEETALQNLAITLCGTIMIQAAHDFGILVFVFYAKYAGGEIKPSSEGDLEWVAFGDVDKLPVVEDLPAILAQLQIWRQNGKLFYGKSHYSDDGKIIINFQH